MSGSSPRGVPTDAYRQIVTLVQDHGAKAVLDADGTALRFGLQAKPFATKPNVNELQRLVAKPLRNERALLQAASRLNQQGIDVVMVSRAGALLMVDRLEQFRRTAQGDGAARWGGRLDGGGLRLYARGRQAA
ncbi:MAG: hypothetical protein U0231_03570 [Nitrospiraceae bacterium]